MMCGGVNQSKDATDEIQDLVEKVRSQLEAKVGKSFPKYKAISYISQIVAGTNFFVKIQTDENEYTHVRIFRSLPTPDSEFTVHSHQTGKSKEDAVTYF
uniref:Cystatin domain-containing protein n=1 Tax=Arion vulgaris TaxID=1028688 RepID=A0A0B6ZKN4_9EUPU